MLNSQRWLGIAFVGCFLGAICIAGSSLAATIEPAITDHCNITLDGRLEPGDAARLEAVIDSAPERLAKRADHEIPRKDICLNSAGGSFPEALKIVELLTRRASEWGSIGTVVDRGAECFAACAYVFMAGRFHAFHGLTFPLRQMHVNGTVGFHLPETREPTGLQDKKVVESAYTEAVRHIAFLMKQNSGVETGFDHNRPYPKSLTGAALSLKPGDTLLIDTVDKAGKWNITLLGVPKMDPSSITDKKLRTACGNYLRWREKPTGSTEPAASDLPPKFSNRMHRTTFKGFGAKSDEYCVVDLYDSAAQGPLINLEHRTTLKAKKGEYVSTPASIKQFFDEGGGDFGQYGILGEPLWAMFEQQSRISDLAGLMQR